jgi:hypothetical protein
MTKQLALDFSQPMGRTISFAEVCAAAEPDERPIVVPPKPKKVKAPRDWQCQECGRRMTLKQAERAMSGINGCPNCGGVDIDLVVS